MKFADMWSKYVVFVENVYCEVTRHYGNLKLNIKNSFKSREILEVRFHDSSIYPRQWVAKCDEISDGLLVFKSARKGCEKHETKIRRRILEYNVDKLDENLVRENRFIWGAVLVMFLLTLQLVFA